MATYYVNTSPGQTVNVRNSASDSGAIATRITHGSHVTANAASGGWHGGVSCYDPVAKVSYSNKYIKSGFLVSSIPTDCYWIARYGTLDIQQTNTPNHPGVDNLQADLNSITSLGVNLTVDGIAGANTIAAIKKFQSANNLTADGVAGNRTKEYLYKVK